MVEHWPHIYKAPGALTPEGRRKQEKGGEIHTLHRFNRKPSRQIIFSHKMTGVT